MKNRHLIIPITSLVAVALALSPLRSQTADSPPVPDVVPTSSGPILAPAAPATAATPKPAATPHTMAYTVVAGDSLTKLADKFNTTRKKLKALNDLASTKLTPGEVILVPAPAASRKSATASATKAKHHTYLAAQPVQDFDIPASTFASCPVPVPSGDDDTPIVPAEEKPAPVAQLVSPSELAADETRPVPATNEIPAKAKPKPLPPVATPAPSGFADESRRPSSPLAHMWSSLTAPRLNNDIGMNTPADSPTNDWGYRFLQQARALGDRGIEYNDDWRPPGERTAWTMDCSNTTRWLYKVTAGINLPRTASDQYYYLRLQGKAWDVPNGPTGWADVGYLQRNLKPGDLLFWENTYRPERQPPITHVMVFLGTNARGQWIMAGSQGSGGEHNRSNGGPDVYVFRPSQACGGYTSWFVHHRGRFCAFGRPLEADPSKFVVND